MNLDASTISTEARRLGFDLVGFVSTERLGAVGGVFSPVGFAPHLRTLIVLARRNYEGLRIARHAGTRQFWGGRLLKRIDDAALRLANFLEDSGASAAPFSSLMVDFGVAGNLDLTPAGQGSGVLRTAGVAAGLGSLGLNGMLLTPEFGPRVYLSGVLTDADLGGPPVVALELCPGLAECGWCAAVCPAGAIPSEAPPQQALSALRGLDRHACAGESQPLGLGRFREQLREVVSRRGDADAVWEAVGGRTTGALWQEMIMIKEGVFTACSECVVVCPVGADVTELEGGPQPPPGFSRLQRDGLVVIEGGKP